MSDISFKSIKSSIIIKYIFSFILETKKLKMIIHNKYFQTKIGIDLNYYKKVIMSLVILMIHGIPHKSDLIHLKLVIMIDSEKI